jgi:DNA-binding transcriptional LysR family regulator
VARRNAQVDWDHLRVFLAVARTRRVAAAARLLQVEHTTVSRRIVALERQLGAPVFHRTAAGFLLTPMGESILPNAEAMERAAVTLGARAREHVGRPAGRVRVAIAPEFASEWLAPEMPTFWRRFPEIELQVLVGTRTLDLSRGEAELALHTPRPRQLGLVTTRLGRTAVALYASHTYLRGRQVFVHDADSARDLTLLVYTPQLHLLQQAVWFQSILAAARVALTTNGTHALLAAARAGAGIAVLPRFAARRYDDLQCVSENVAEHDVWLTTHPEFRRDPKVRATADFLQEIARRPGGLV